MECIKWLGVNVVLSSKPSVNLLHFIRLIRGRKGVEIVVCIWECALWIIWKSRNAVVFRNGEVSLQKMVSEVKSSFKDWEVNPSLILQK